MSEEALKAISQTNFGTIDTVIVVVYLSISLVIGVLVNRFAGSMDNYIGAGRKVGPWLGVATMTGTELGLITVMYSAQKGFTGGFAAFHIALIAGIVTFFVGLTGFIVGPLRRMKVLTIPEYYEKRFNKRVRVLGGILLVFGGVLNMGLFLKVGSMFIVGITGVGVGSHTLMWVMIGLLVLVLSYTIMGGMISVILTDYVQFVVLSCSLLVATYIAIAHLGWNNIFETVHKVKEQSGFDPTVGEAGFGWAYIVWMIFIAGLVSCAVWPTAVARALAMESEKAVRKQYCWSSISFATRFIIPQFLGICAMVYIANSAGAEDLRSLFSFDDAVRGSEIKNLYAMPIVLGRLLPAGFIGIVTAGMIAAFMSTHDSYFLAFSSVITQDIVAPLQSKPMSTAARIKVTRFSIILMGGYVLYWGFFYNGNEDIWDYMAVTGGIYATGAFVVLFFGLYWKPTSSFGATAGLLSGWLMLLGLEPVQRFLGMGKVIQKMVGGELKPRWDPTLSGAQVGLIVVSISIVLTIVGSLLVPDQSEDNPQELEEEKVTA